MKISWGFALMMIAILLVVIGTSAAVKDSIAVIASVATIMMMGPGGILGTGSFFKPIQIL